MSDIFREVDEDIRRERFKKLWDRFGVYVIALAVLIVVATAGYRIYVYLQEKEAEEAGDKFTAALQLASGGKHDEAVNALSEIVADGSGGYPVLARFRIATEKVATGDKTGAVAELDAVANDGSAQPLIRDMARLRAALILVETASLADLEARIGSLAGTGNPWRNTARELLGLGAWRAGDFAAARKYFQQISDDQDKPRDIAQRADVMLALIKGKLGEPAEEPKPEG
jgi:hypothetical protein